MINHLPATATALGQEELESESREEILSSIERVITSVDDKSPMPDFPRQARDILKRDQIDEAAWRQFLKTEKPDSWADVDKVIWAATAAILLDVRQQFWVDKALNQPENLGLNLAIVLEFGTRVAAKTVTKIVEYLTKCSHKDVRQWTTFQEFTQRFESWAKDAEQAATILLKIIDAGKSKGEAFLKAAGVLLARREATLPRDSEIADRVRSRLDAIGRDAIKELGETCLGAAFSMPTLDYGDGSESLNATNNLNDSYVHDRIGSIGQVGGNEVADRVANWGLPGGREVRSKEEKIRELFTGLPEEPKARLDAVGGRVEEFRSEAIRQLQTALNAFLGTQTPQSIDDKHVIAEVVQVHLNRLGLAISYKGQACNLAVTVGKDYPRGRFLLNPVGSNKPLLARVNLSDFLPLELMDAPARREGLKEYRERANIGREAPGVLQDM